MQNIDYEYNVVQNRHGFAGRQYTATSIQEKEQMEKKAEDIEPNVKTSYRFKIPWYLKVEYRRQHQLSLKDIREMLSSTPVSLLLQLALFLNVNLNHILAPETLTDHSWMSLQHWLAQVRDASQSHYWKFNDALFKDDTRLLTALVNALYKYFEFEYTREGSTETKGGDKCICPFDTHTPLLPIHQSNEFEPVLKQAQPGHRLKLIFQGNEQEWAYRGPYHGYQKWQNVLRSEELILIQTPAGHQYLQNWELQSKKRKETYLARWFDKLYLGSGC